MNTLTAFEVYDISKQFKKFGDFTDAAVLAQKADILALKNNCL